MTNKTTHRVNDYGYTSLSILPDSKDKFIMANIGWNIKNKNLRKTKAEFFEFIVNFFIEKQKMEIKKC
jgi:hypothetical protein